MSSGASHKGGNALVILLAWDRAIPRPVSDNIVSLEMYRQTSRHILLAVVWRNYNPMSEQWSGSQGSQEGLSILPTPTEEEGTKPLGLALPTPPWLGIPDLLLQQISRDERNR